MDQSERKPADLVVNLLASPFPLLSAAHKIPCTSRSITYYVKVKVTVDQSERKPADLVVNLLRSIVLATQPRTPRRSDYLTPQSHQLTLKIRK
jgi:hypothetical protein